MQQQMVMTNQGQPVHVVQQPNVGTRQPQGCCSLKGVAIAENAFGVLNFILSAAAVGVAASLRLAGIFLSGAGIWSGILLVALGRIGMAQTKNENQVGINSGGLVVGIVACITMVIAFGISAACVYYSSFSAAILSSYSIRVGTLDALVALHAMLTFAELVGFALSVTHAVLSSSRNNQMQAHPAMMIATVPAQQYQIPVAGQQPPGYQQQFANPAYPTAEKAQPPQQHDQAYQNPSFATYPTNQ